jgi:hypothetical protein
MRFWIRELAGWFLVVLGLYLFLICVDRALYARWVLEPVPIMIIGIVVFRGGIHLLKVAVAARICMRAHDKTSRV